MAEIIHIADSTILDRYIAVLGWDPKLGSEDPHRTNFTPQTKALRFTPPTPSVTPTQLFTHQAAEHPIGQRCHSEALRFMRRGNPSQFLIYVSGSCVDNGGPNAHAGCAFIFKPAPDPTKDKSCAFRLELQGPTGDVHPQTTHRAELRAVDWRRLEELGHCDGLFVLRRGEEPNWYGSGPLMVEI